MKLKGGNGDSSAMLVAPRTGAWIETLHMLPGTGDALGRPPHGGVD